MPFSSDTGTLRTDGQTDGKRQTDRRTDLLYQYRASVCWRAIKTTPVNHAISGILHAEPHVQPNFLSGWRKLVVVDLVASSWHSTLLAKMSELDLPECVYNWLVEFFSEHYHCTVYNGQTSTMKKITASIIQGSGIGPAAYVVTAGDLTVKDPANKLIKFADDAYLVIPATRASTRRPTTEIENVGAKKQSVPQQIKNQRSYIQSPSVTSHPHFKVTIVFNIK